MAFPTGWGRKQKITIDNTKVSGSGSHANFGMLITLDHLDTEIVDAGSNSALNGGGDIRISTDAAGTTQLAVDVVNFVTNATEGNRRCELWVKVPSVSTSADTDIYIWYKKAGETQPAVTDTFGRNAVWSDELAVYHLENTTDSAGGSSLTTNGDAAFVDDFIGKGVELDGTGDFLSGVPDPTSGVNRQGSIRHWLTPDSLLADQFAVQICDGTSAAYNGKGDTSDILEVGTYLTGSSSRVSYQDGTNNVLSLLEAGAAAANTPVFTSMTWDKDGTLFLYTDLSDVESTDMSGTTWDDHAVTIGFIGSTGAQTSGRFWDGTIDEVKIRDDEQLSADYITTEYNNQFAPATFATAGTPEDADVSQINTRQKQFCAMNWGRGMLLPDPLGAGVSDAEKQTFLNMYCGIPFQTVGAPTLSPQLMLTGVG